jgi:DNA-binding transcriptional LysR family regulator
MKMKPFSVHDIQCLDAVVREGGFQAAAALLGRSHTAVFASIAKLERNLGLTLLDRSGYRVVLTDAGLSFHRKAKPLLDDMQALELHARQLAIGEESQLCVVLGDAFPLPEGLQMLSSFFAQYPNTRLDLRYETISGPHERLWSNEADLILHWADKADPRLEWIELGTAFFLPVVAPGFLPFEITGSISPDQMRKLTQCIIRDTGRLEPKPNYFVIEGAPHCTVSDHLMKREIILRGMAWGHLPSFMIEQDLSNGHLQSIAGQYLTGIRTELVAARRRDRPHGPVATRLWDHIGAQAPHIRANSSSELANDRTND